MTTTQSERPLTSHPPWHQIIPVEEQALYNSIGLGSKSAKPGKAALLVIDVQYRSVGSKPMPIQEAIKEYPTSCGTHGWKSVAHISTLIEEFRASGFPVIFPYVAPKKAYDGGRWADKAPAVMTIPSRGYDFVEEVAPLVGDILLPKQHASAFFGTPLVSYLVDNAVSTVFVTGATTSGCVRATVVDASSLGFRVVVPHEAVYDRSQVSSAVNLFDMNSKYADVMSVHDAVSLLRQSSTVIKELEGTSS